MARRKRSIIKKLASKVLQVRRWFYVLVPLSAAAQLTSCSLPWPDSIPSLPHLAQIQGQAQRLWSSMSQILPSAAARSSQSPPSAAPTGNAAAKLSQTSFRDCKGFFPNQQPPRVPSLQATRELCFASFAILHSGHFKTPVFVVQRMNRASLQRAASIARTDRFYADARLPSRERAELADYKGSGFSRGHMAPAGDMDSLNAMAQSFSLANIVPQDQKHNAGAWAKIEKDTRAYVMRAKGDVFVFTGPVFSASAQRIGPGKVAVPTHLFKLVYDPSTQKSWAHFHQNSPSQSVGKPISYQELSARIGMELLPTSQ